jgi:hypothetical protein
MGFTAMNWSDKALVGVGAFMSATMGIGAYGFTLSGALATIGCAIIWGAALGLINGWRR